jgi:hypothetical protein
MELVTVTITLVIGKALVFLNKDSGSSQKIQETSKRDLPQALKKD